MRITLVGKMGLDGKICSKSALILKKLQDSGLLSQIDRIILADDRDRFLLRPNRNRNNEGFALATQYQVENLPFFIITYHDGTTKAYTTYAQLVNEFFRQKTLNI